jgi:hypothetical protein
MVFYDALTAAIGGALGGAGDPGATQRALMQSVYNMNDANERAKTLLIAHLTKRQRVDFAAKGSFTVKTDDGGEFQVGCDGYYVIELKRTRWRKKAKWRSFCVHPVGTNYGYLPLYDCLLAFLIWLRADVRHFRRQAVARRWVDV